MRMLLSAAQRGVEGICAGENLRAANGFAQVGLRWLRAFGWSRLVARSRLTLRVRHVCDSSGDAEVLCHTPAQCAKVRCSATAVTARCRWKYVDSFFVDANADRLLRKHLSQGSRSRLFSAQSTSHINVCSQAYYSSARKYGETAHVLEMNDEKDWNKPHKAYSLKQLQR